MMPDCSLKNIGHSYGEVWLSIFYVLSDYYGSYVEGLVGSDNRVNSSIFIGGSLVVDMHSDFKRVKIVCDSNHTIAL